MKLEYLVKANEYQTVKEVLKSHFHLSDRLLLKLKRHNQIFLNGNLTFPHSPLHPNDVVCCQISFAEKSENILPAPIPFDIIFEDTAMLIVNKPAGTPVHPSMAHFSDSLSNGVQYYFEQHQIHTKIRPVNRLDKDTSGIVLFAKNEYVQENLITQMANHTFQKFYLALLSGVLDENHKNGTIDANITRKENSIIGREIHPNGQKAITHYQLIQNYSDFCLVKFKLETGRTHQIRVHCKHIGHSILGDTLYGTPSPLLARQALHAYKVQFIHPVSKQPMEFEIPLPEDMQMIIQSHQK